MNTTLQTQKTTTIEPAVFPDGKLVQQALAGSQQAFEILVHRYNASLFRFISSFVRDYDRASDIYQQVLIQLYVSLPNLNLEKPIRPWLFQVARHRCIDDLRRGYMTHFSELEDEYEEDYYQDQYAIPDPAPPPEELIEQGEVRNYLCEAIRSLPQHYRTIVALRYTSRLTFVEIGETLGIPETTARTYFQRAKPLMRASLKSIVPEQA